MYLTRYRQYSGKLGRWLNRDPGGENFSLNLYGYFASDPINGTDPLGLQVQTLPAPTEVLPSTIRLGRPAGIPKYRLSPSDKLRFPWPGPDIDDPNDMDTNPNEWEPEYEWFVPDKDKCN